MRGSGRRTPYARLRSIATRHLSAAEAAQLAALPVPKRRLEWLAGRLASKYGVRAYLSRHFGEHRIDPRDVRVTQVGSGPEAGRPLVAAPAAASGQRIEIGLSHSGDFAVAACAPGAIGIDIERRRELPSTLLPLLASDPDAPANPDHLRLHRMPLPLRWSCVEAVLKYCGLGLRVDVREVRLTGWSADGRFSWRAGPQLRCQAPRVAEAEMLGSWACEVGEYCVAMVWDR